MPMVNVSEKTLDGLKKTRDAEQLKSLDGAIRHLLGYEPHIKRENIFAEDFAYMNLRFFSEYCWQDIAGQVPNGPFQDEWYQLLQGNDRPPRLHIQTAREHGKTTCLAVKYPLWRVGRDPSLRVMIVGKSAMMATMTLREIKRNIESNQRLQGVFPLMRPDVPWSGNELQVERGHEIILKDPSFVGVGLHGPLTGRRADLIILDDPFNETDVRTEAQRKKIEDWIEKILVPTLTPSGEIVAVGTPQHDEDYWNRLEEKSIEPRGNYIVKKYPAIRDYDLDIPIEAWKVQWSEVWTAKKLAERRREIGQIKFNRLYLLDSE